MCLVVTKGNWITKNKEPVRKSSNLLTIYREDLPYEWSYLSLPIFNDLVDLNEIISGLGKEDLKKIEVEEKKNDRVRDIKEIVPEEEIRPSPLFVPVLFHRSPQDFVGITSTTDYNRYWEGMGKRGAITTAIHHLGRGDFLSVSHILKKVALSDKYLPLIEEYVAHNPVMGFTMTIADEKNKTIVDHLYENLFLTKTRESGYNKKSKYKRVMDVGYTAFQAFWKYYIDGVGIARTANYDDVLVRTNFSPHLGYWDLDFNPDQFDEVREKKFIRCLTRYLRAYQLFKGDEELNIKKILDKMSDHGYHPTLKNKYMEIYNLIKEDKLEKALSKFRKVEYDPSPYSLCNHGTSWKPMSTAFNFTVNTEKREIYYTHGNPCRNRLTIKYSLD